MACLAASVNKILWMPMSEDVTSEEYASLNKLQLTRCTNTSSSGGDSSEFSAIPTNFKYTGLDYDGYEFVDDSIHEQVSIAIPSKANRPIEDIERENVKDSDLIVFKHDTPVIVEEPAGQWFNWQQLESVEPVEQSDRGWNIPPNMYIYIYIYYLFLLFRCCFSFMYVCLRVCVYASGVRMCVYICACMFACMRVRIVLQLRV